MVSERGVDRKGEEGRKKLKRGKWNGNEM